MLMILINRDPIVVTISVSGSHGVSLEVRGHVDIGYRSLLGRVIEIEVPPDLIDNGKVSQWPRCVD